MPMPNQPRQPRPLPPPQLKRAAPPPPPKQPTSLPSLRCPKAHGGCGRDYAFRVAISPGPRRGVMKLVVECTACSRKFDFILAHSVTDLNGGKVVGPLDSSGAPIKLT